MVITLPPQLEAILSEQAQRRGMAPEVLALDALRLLVRYADDFVMGFACEEDARRVLAVLPKRLGKYGLTIHPDKTKLVPFERPSFASERTDETRREPPGTFD